MENLLISRMMFNVLVYL